MTIRGIILSPFQPMAQQYKVQRYEGQIQNALPPLPTKASTAIVQGRFLTIDTNGYIVEATDSTSTVILGYSLQAKASSDTSTDPIAIDVLRKGDLLRVIIDSGGSATAATSQAMVGDTCDIASTGGLAQATDTHHDVRILSMNMFAAHRVADATSEILVSLNNAMF